MKRNEAIIKYGVETNVMLFSKNGFQQGKQGFWGIFFGRNTVQDKTKPFEILSKKFGSKIFYEI